MTNRIRIRGRKVLCETQIWISSKLRYICLYDILCSNIRRNGNTGRIKLKDDTNE